MKNLLSLLTIMSSCFYLANVPLIRADIIFFVFSVILIFTYSIGLSTIKIIPNHVNKEFGVLLMLALINCFLHSFSGAILSNMISLFLGIALITILKNIDIEKIEDFLVYGGLINILVLALQYCGVNILNSNVSEFGGLMGNAPRLCMLLAITLPFAYKKHWSIAILYCLVCLLLKEIGIFIVLIILSLYLLKDVKKKIIILFGFISLCVLAKEQIAQSLSIRLETWKDTLNVFFLHPLTGIGLGLSPYGKDAYPVEIDNHIFSSALRFITGLGILSLLWIKGAYNCTKNLFKKDVYSCAIISLLVLCVFEYPLEVPRLWFPICLIIAMFLKKGE